MPHAPSHNIKPALVADEGMRSAHREQFMVQDRFLAILITIGTYPMGWLAFFHAFFKAVSERPLPSVLQLIALLVCRPIFHAHDFLFKRVYALQIRRMNALGLGQAALRVEQMALDFEDGSVDSRLTFQRNNARRYVARELKALKTGLDFGDHINPR